MVGSGPSPIPAPAPEDPALCDRIHKFITYLAKNGPEFEATVRNKQMNNPDFQVWAFLGG